MNQKTILFLLCGINILHAGFPQNTLIRTDKSYRTIQEFSSQDTLLAFDLNDSWLATSKVIYTLSLSVENCYRIHFAHDSILCSDYQKFYDPLLKKWLRARELTEQSYLLNANGDHIRCIRIEKIVQNLPVTMYEISLESPHTYFVSQAQILTHNVTPVLIGLSWAFGEGISLTGIGIGLGRLGLGLWQKFGANQKTTFAQIQQECKINSAGGTPDPDDEKKIENMKKFFQSEFGKKIEKSLEKTYKIHQGKTVYRVKEKIPEYGLKKGDQLYLDNLHKDHLELFGKDNKIVAVLNLDGTKNVIKSIKAAGRTL